MNVRGISEKSKRISAERVPGAREEEMRRV